MIAKMFSYIQLFSLKWKCVSLLDVIYDLCLFFFPINQI